MAEQRRELLIGCGRRRTRHIQVDGLRDWSGLETLDKEPSHEPDILADLEVLPYSWAPSDYYDEIHAYEVLEHTGNQGDAAFFFAQFSEFWRILKPGGVLCGTCPGFGSPWVWGDPSHKRAIQAESLVFLEQVRYSEVGVTPMSDFRSIYRADFIVEQTRHETPGGPHLPILVFVLRAVKPARLSA
jgi:SAM-dependent methyltransferase